MTQWKERFGNFSEDPDRFQNEFLKLNSSFTLTWQDVLSILNHCCTPEEKTGILKEAREYANSLAVSMLKHDVMRFGWDSVPDQNPQWDYRDPLGKARMEYFTICISVGMKRCQVKPENYSKVCEITQEKEENSHFFLSRLTEAMRKYSNINPKSAEGEYTLCQPGPLDIKRKLQKLGFYAPLSVLVEEAVKVFNNRGWAKEAKKMVTSLSQEDPRPRRPGQDKCHGWSSLRWDQCAYCKKEGHWKQDCPKKEGTQTGNALIIPGSWAGLTTLVLSLQPLGRDSL